ncbi:hypothetical protein Lal_00037242 [Lupinus albus]|nr:hypothetical protein Lal_00037242 [Lupinus albus]
MQRIKTRFDFSSTAAQVLEGVDLTGKTMIVTGGGSGIGYETVLALASAGAAVTIAARRPHAARRRGRCGQLAPGIGKQRHRCARARRCRSRFRAPFCFGMGQACACAHQQRRRDGLA